MSKQASGQKRFLTPGWLMFGSAMLTVLLVPVLQATLNSSSENADRYQQLASMTASERAKIEHAFAEFQKLSPQQQESYRELDRRLNNEDLDLKATLADYQAFLSSLSPIDRAELDQATSKRDKLGAIKQIQQERERRREQLEAGLAEWEEDRSHYRSHDAVLSSAEMEAIAAIIERELPAEVRRQVQLESFTGPARFIASVAGVSRAADIRNPGQRGEWRPWFEEGVLTEIESAIHNQDIRKKLSEADSLREKDFKLRFTIFHTIRRLLTDAYPGPAELARFLDAQDKETRDWLNSIGPQDMVRELGRMYLQKNKSKLPLVLAFDQFSRPPWFILGGRRGGPERSGRNDRGPDRGDRFGRDNDDEDGGRRRGRE